METDTVVELLPGRSNYNKVVIHKRKFIPVETKISVTEAAR